MEKSSQMYGNKRINLGDEEIVDLGIGNLYPGEGKGEVFLPRGYAEELVDIFRLCSDPKISDILPSYDKDGEDGFDLNGTCELRYDNSKLSLVGASGKVYDRIEKYNKDFSFHRYIADLDLVDEDLAGGEAGDEFEPEKDRFRDKHPNLFKGAAIGAACLLPVGFGIGAYCTSDNPVKDIVKDIKESDFAKYISHAAAKDINPNKDNVSKGIYKPTSPIKTIEDNRDESIAFDTGKGGYPSIPGEHQGNFTPKEPMNISKVYTYPSPGTGGHIEKIAFFYQNGTEIGNASWNGYEGDWHNISFDEQPIELKGNEVYKYLIKTGSYPQIIHKQNLSNSDGIITCSEFVDANSKKYNNGIPAFKLFEKVVPDTTPPGPVTDLNESKMGQKYINWSWNKPPDEDFKGVKVYLDDAFVGDLERGANRYNATNLTEDTLYKLGVRPYDKVGNIGGWTNDTARTLKIPNQNPIAIFNYNPKNPKVNQSILFNASNSHDPDGEIDQYLWDFNNDNITDAHGKTSNHPYSAAGIKQAILKVIDNQGAENKTSREINVEPPGNKTWEEMNFTERKDLVELFLEKDPTPYSEIGQCLYIADALYQNATNAKELYGLEDNIPMGLDHNPEYANGHISNAVFLGNNKSDIQHWGFINGEDYISIFNKNITFPIELDRLDYIWANGIWITPDELYRLTNYSVGFDVHWEPNQKPNITIVPTYPTEHQDLYPA